MRKRSLGAGWIVVGMLLMAAAGMAQDVPNTEAASVRPSTAFDPDAATQAYLARLSTEQRARSDAYFEGGYWLQLVGFSYGLAVAWLLLSTRLSARMRDLARRIAPWRPLQTALYWVQYLGIVSLLTFPLTLYQGYFREHAYGLATQSFGPWLADLLKGLAVGALLGSLAFALLYGVLRRAPRTWWLWGSVVSVLFLAFVSLIAPVWIAPVFNAYTPLEDPAVRGPIMRLAAANGIPGAEVYQMDASRQTTRISAHVSGMLGTERITLNDNLLEKCSLAEIEAVMAHEIGHYVLNHVYEGLLQFGLVFVLGFVFLRWSFDRVLRRFGGRWGVEGIANPAGLPLLAALFSVYMFAMTPVTNTIIRSNEAEADLFGLNASRQPDGFAEAALKLAEYRKLDPGPVEEWLLFDHPSGRTRIQMAMRWKAAHPEASPAVEP